MTASAAPRGSPGGTGRSAIGVLLVAAHAAGFAALVTRCRGSELAVDVHAAPAAPTAAFAASLPAELAGRVTVTDSPPGPGLHRRRWTVVYRGGIERSVGAVQLVGPFQDPAAARCVGRAIVGQRLLDDGRAGPGTVAAAMAAQLDAVLRDADIFPVGALERVEQLGLRWAELDRHPEDTALVEIAPHGYVRVSATVVFERVSVPLVVALIPAASPSELRFRIAVAAQLSFDNGVVQWISDRLGAERLATRLARRQIDDVLTTVLAPPPPFTLPGGQTLRFTYCDEPAEIADGAYGALPFGIALGTSASDPQILPPRHGRGPRSAPSPATQLALDLDLDALNALLYELWRGKFLDRRLADAGLDRRFNSDPTVTELLTVRLSPPTLALPPVVSVGPDGLELSAEARIAIRDGATRTTGRLWGGLAFRFARQSPDEVAAVAVELRALELSCERTATTLVPCYGDLVAAIRGRAGELHGALTSAFAELVSAIFVGRFGVPGVPGVAGGAAAAGAATDLVISSVRPSVATAAGNATLRLELDAAIGVPR